jgi:hypothetical protein
MRHANYWKVNQNLKVEITFYRAKIKGAYYDVEFKKGDLFVWLGWESIREVQDSCSSLLYVGDVGDEFRMVAPNDVSRCLKLIGTCFLTTKELEELNEAVEEAMHLSDENAENVRGYLEKLAAEERE